MSVQLGHCQNAIYNDVFILLIFCFFFFFFFLNIIFKNISPFYFHIFPQKKLNYFLVNLLCRYGNVTSASPLPKSLTWGLPMAYQVKFCHCAFKQIQLCIYLIRELWNLEKKLKIIMSLFKVLST